MVKFIIRKPTIRYIDLCCGIGGFRVALDRFTQKQPRQRFKCVLSADIKDDALKTYNANFGEANEKQDVTCLTNVPPFDLLCAGFPCQPFSSAGHKKGFDDTRGSIVFALIELCKTHQPKFVILENVANLITLDGGKQLERICSEFQKIGYQVSFRKLNAKDFGVPQNRERVFIVCSKSRKICLETIRPVQPTVLKTVLDTTLAYTDIDSAFAQKILALHKKTPLYGFKMQDKRGGSKNIHSWDIENNGPITDSEKALMNEIMTQRRKKHWAEAKGIEWMDGMPLTLTEIQTFCKVETRTLETMLANLVEKKYLRLEKPKGIVNGKREYVENGLLGYNICKGKLSFPISNILDPEGIAPTLTATDSDKLVAIIDNHYIRRLSINELKKVCGFPETFVIPSDVNAFDLFGNMVVPPVVEGILECIFCSE
jgi:DNA (cytosine-5)-methyltransferase 1